MCLMMIFGRDRVEEEEGMEYVDIGCAIYRSTNMNLTPFFRAKWSTSNTIYREATMAPKYSIVGMSLSSSKLLVVAYVTLSGPWVDVAGRWRLRWKLWLLANAKASATGYGGDMVVVSRLKKRCGSI